MMVMVVVHRDGHRPTHALITTHRGELCVGAARHLFPARLRVMPAMAVWMAPAVVAAVGRRGRGAAPHLGPTARRTTAADHHTTAPVASTLLLREAETALTLGIVVVVVVVV